MKTLEVLAGSDIDSTIREAIAEASQCGDQVMFDFNGVKVIVTSESQPDLIYRDWNRALQGCTDSPVGPYPAYRLSDEELKKYEAIEAENEAGRRQAQAEYDAKQRSRLAAVSSILDTAAPLDLIDQDGFTKYREVTKDPYDARCVSYAEDWGRLMQVEMASGKSLVEVADTTSHQADTDGITGLMYGCAVSILVKYWRHGEELRKWHNKEYGHEGAGVVNPAILVVSDDKPDDQPLDPYKTMLVVKHEGREVGRIAATATNAEAYMNELVSHYGSCQVDYVEDPDAAMVSQMLNGSR